MTSVNRKGNFDKPGEVEGWRKDQVVKSKSMVENMVPTQVRSGQNFDTVE